MDAIEAARFRQAMGRFGTGVTIVTALDDNGMPVGMTANSFTSVSLEPPLVLFCPSRTAESFGPLVAGGAFVINVLSEGQRAMSDRFARSHTDKWQGVPFDTWETGVPVLRECLANLECTTHAVHDGGDHAIVVGRVKRLASVPSGRPLLYFGGGYAGIGGGD